MQNRRLLTEYGAAEMLNTTPAHIRQMVRGGQIPVVILPGEVIRFDPVKLQDFFAIRTRPSVENLTTR